MGWCKLLSGSRAKPWWGISVEGPIVFCSWLQNRRKLAHRKNKIFVLFCITSAINMFTLHWINNSSFFYVNRHVYYTSNHKLFLLLCKKCFCWHFYKRTIWKQKMFTIQQIKSSSLYLKNILRFYEKRISKRICSVTILCIKITQSI